MPATTLSYSCGLPTVSACPSTSRPITIKTLQHVSPKLTRDTLCMHCPMAVLRCHNTHVAEMTGGENCVLLVVDGVEYVVVQAHDDIGVQDVVWDKVLNLGCWDACEPQLSIAEGKAMPSFALLTCSEMLDACSKAWQVLRLWCKVSRARLLASTSY